MKRKDERYNEKLKQLRKGAADMDRLALAPQAATLPAPDVIAKVLLGGDLAQLSPQQKISYYRSVCDSLGLNPLTQPFEYLRLSGREVLYAKRNCTDQLRHRHSISVQITSREEVSGCYIVTARASFPDGRHDESIGAVPFENLKGEARANAVMKCETKAKRRVTLSLVGLSTLDESEVDSIPGAQPVPIPSPEPAALAPDAGAGLGAPAAPAIPDAWKPFAADRLSGRIVAISDETKTNKKGTPFTKWSITLDSGELVTTLDRDHADTAIMAKHDEANVEITTKETRWGKDILTIARLPEAESDEAF